MKASQFQIGCREIQCRYNLGLMKYLKLAGFLTLIAITGCQSVHVMSGRPAFASPIAPVAPPNPNYWDEEEVKGESSVVISLSEQRAYFYKDKRAVGRSTISSGRKGFETPPGNYKITQKDMGHVSNLYGDYVSADGEIVKRNVDVTKDPMPAGTVFRGAKMPYFMRFTGGYGLHAGYLPGYRASHGCIRMPRVMAKHFFENVSIGTPVTVED